MRRCQRAVRFADTALDDVLDGDRLERSHVPLGNDGSRHAGAEAPRQRCHDAGMSPLVGARAAGFRGQRLGRAVRSQLARQPREGRHRRGLQLSELGK